MVNKNRPATELDFDIRAKALDCAMEVAGARGKGHVGTAAIMKDAERFALFLEGEPMGVRKPRAVLKLVKHD